MSREKENLQNQILFFNITLDTNPLVKKLLYLYIYHLQALTFLPFSSLAYFWAVLNSKVFCIPSTNYIFEGFQTFGKSSCILFIGWSLIRLRTSLSH
jgi:hypothetical protein